MCGVRIELNILGLNFGVSSSGIKVPIVGRIGAPRIPLPIEEAPPWYSAPNTSEADAG